MLPDALLVRGVGHAIYRIAVRGMLHGLQITNSGLYTPKVRTPDYALHFSGVSESEQNDRGSNNRVRSGRIGRRV